MTATPSATSDRWLSLYYAVRAAFSVAWVVLAFTIGRSQPLAATVLIIAYPLWDCLANLADARRNGGLRANPTQALNVVVSAIVALVVAATVGRDFHLVIAAIGLWAALSGILQLATALRRRRSAGAQWPMILSGAQSCLAAAHFVMEAANRATMPGVADVAPYAAFGALYFVISATILLVRQR